VDYCFSHKRRKRKGKKRSPTRTIYKINVHQRKIYRLKGKDTSPASTLSYTKARHPVSKRRRRPASQPGLPKVQNQKR